MVSFVKIPLKTPLVSNRRPDGFTLIEVLVSLVIILTATIGSIVAFNLIIQSLRGTGLRADQSRRIDRQIAEISRIAEVYTACGSADGEAPDAPIVLADVCSGSLADVQVGNSFYYFPDPADVAAVSDFFDACRSIDEESHITWNFIDAIDDIGPAGGGVVRLDAERVDGDDADNHLVEVIWENPGGRELRRLRIAPLLSSWCP